MVNKPVISVNKLGEYLVCRAARKRTLLRQRKYPDEFQVGTYHREAAEAIQRYLADGALDPLILENALNSLNQMVSGNIGTIRRINSNIERIESFWEMLDDIDFKGAVPELGPNAGRMNICGVDISVRPEIILRGAGPKGRKLVGAVKLQLSASTRFDEEAAGYVSAAVQEYCRRSISVDEEVVHAAYCRVIDIGNEIVHPGVRSTRQRLRDIEAECQNIVALWPSI